MKSNTISKIISKSFMVGAVLTMFVFVSCSTHRHTVMYHGQDMGELVRAASRLGFAIEEDDDWALMIEASTWMGVPYRYGGDTRAGVDCSGLTCAIYEKVYGKRLHRRSIEQYQQDTKHRKLSKLRQGDLVFFSTSSGTTPSADNINHTGIYLRDGKFIHASSSRGVVIDNLSTAYYARCWVGGGRVNK